MYVRWTSVIGLFRAHPESRKTQSAIPAATRFFISIVGICLGSFRGNEPELEGFLQKQRTYRMKNTETALEKQREVISVPIPAGPHFTK
jgi:hypothetical protein